MREIFFPAEFWIVCEAPAVVALHSTSKIPYSVALFCVQSFRSSFAAWVGTVTKTSIHTYSPVFSQIAQTNGTKFDASFPWSVQVPGSSISPSVFRVSGEAEAGIPPKQSHRMHPRTVCEFSQFLRSILLCEANIRSGENWHKQVNSLWGYSQMIIVITNAFLTFQFIKSYIFWRDEIITNQWKDHASQPVFSQVSRC